MITPSMFPAGLGISPPLNVPLDPYEGKFSRSYKLQLGDMTSSFDILIDEIEDSEECKQYLAIFAEAKDIQKKFRQSFCLQCWHPCSLKKKIRELEIKRTGIQNSFKNKTENNQIKIFQAKQDTLSKEQDMKKIMKNEIDHNASLKFEQKQKKYEQKLASLKQQFDEQMKKMKAELDMYLKKAEEYEENTINKLESMKTEFIDLYEIAQKFLQTIEHTEEGGYSQGLISINIPKKDKPLFPNKQKHKLLYKVMEQRKYLRSTKKTNKAMEAFRKTYTTNIIQKQSLMPYR